MLDVPIYYLNIFTAYNNFPHNYLQPKTYFLNFFKPNTLGGTFCQHFLVRTVPISFERAQFSHKAAKHNNLEQIHKLERKDKLYPLY